MVDGVGVHALHEAQVIGDGCCMWQEVAYPGPTLSPLLEGFDGLQHDFSGRVARHRAEALALEVILRNRFAVLSDDFGFVVKKIHMGGRPILAKINHSLGFCRVMGESFQTHSSACGGLSLLSQEPLPVEQRGQGGRPKALCLPAKKVSSIDAQCIFDLRGGECHGLIRG